MALLWDTPLSGCLFVLQPYMAAVLYCGSIDQLSFLARRGCILYAEDLYF